MSFDPKRRGANRLIYSLVADPLPIQLFIGWHLCGCLWHGGAIGHGSLLASFTGLWNDRL